MSKIKDFFSRKKQVSNFDQNKLNKLEESFPGIVNSKNPYEYMEQFSNAWMAKQFAERKRNKANGGSNESYDTIQFYVKAYTKVSSIRSSMIKEVEELRGHYIVDSMISQLVEDAFTPEIGTGDILSVSYETVKEDKDPDAKIDVSDSPFHKDYKDDDKLSDSDKLVSEEIDELDKRIHYDRIATNIAPDLILYGDYVLRTEIYPHDQFPDKDSSEEPEKQKKRPKSPFESILKPSKEEIDEYVDDKAMYKKDQDEDPDEFDYQDGKEVEIGLADLHDDIDQSEIVCLSDDGLVVGYLMIDENGNIEKKEPYEYVKFSVDSQRLRIDLLNEINKNVYGNRSSFIMPQKKYKKLPEGIPRFIRIGKSCIYPVISKIKELILMESLVPATKIEKLTSGTIVGLQVPPNYDIQKALNATEKVEGILNKKLGVDQDLGELTIENIMSAAGRIKVVPQFGSEKGGLDKIDIRSDEPDDLLSSIEDIRRVILSSVGIPYELVFDADGQNKGEILKRYARYLRKLKNIQKAVQEGIKQIIIIHLVNKGVEFDENNIRVEFRNKLVEVDNLDKLEFIDTTVGMLDNLKGFVDSLNEDGAITQGRVNVEGFIDFLNEQLSVVGLGNIISDKKDLENEEPEDPVETIKKLQEQINILMEKFDKDK